MSIIAQKLVTVKQSHHSSTFPEQNNTLFAPAKHRTVLERNKIPVFLYINNNFAHKLTKIAKQEYEFQ